MNTNTKAFRWHREQNEIPIATIIDLKIGDAGLPILTVKEHFMTVSMTLTMKNWNTLANAYGANGMDWIGKAVQVGGRGGRPDGSGLVVMVPTESQP